MRQARKQEILNFINGLHEAHDEIRSAIEKKEIVAVQTMLAECQEFAVDLGKAIEQTEGEDCITVSYVEEYCEAVFRVYEEIVLSEGEESSIDLDSVRVAGRTFKKLKKQLLRLENSVKNDIRVRKEIVFFPYKASMWDSLESVYFAARENPDCDAYCVPIPYFDLNPDHSFGTMHYEGGEYPNDIDVIDWQKYNFEERRPDIIYIHNPYDEWNHVTSVHPRFYARNLKDYTEQLVYIPYFILKEIKRDAANREYLIKNMEHFCFMPGTIYADKVIVQSEDMRQIYIDVYLREAKKSGLTGEHLDRKFLEQKIWGLGSPKLDKVRKTGKGDLEIPEDWKKMLKKPDGSLKKVVFYNTCISAMLQYGEEWLDKLEDTLKVFYVSRDKVALLWRPHPLIENTLKSMRPGLLQKYLEIRNQYINEGWGIYDDTSDLDRAIALSDAYYGDGSSVIQLYHETGKLVMQQNVKILYSVFGDQDRSG